MPSTEAAVRDDVAVGPDGADRFEHLDTFLRRTRYAQDQLIEALHVAQDLYGYLSEDVLRHLARELELPASRVYGVATFYHLFVFEPPGAHTCTICTGTACFVKGSDAIVTAVEGTYAIIPGGTTADGELGLTTARCLGSCGLAPVMVLDGHVRGHQSPEAALALLGETLSQEGGRGLMATPIDLHEVAHREAEARSRFPWRIKACGSTSCLSAGAGPVRSIIERAVDDAGLQHDVQVTATGCMGLCSRGPLVRVEPRAADPTLYADVDADGGASIVRDHVAAGGRASATVLDESMPFFARQHRIVLADAGRIDPDRLEDYVAEGGYRALAAALQQPPADVVEMVTASGLRGRGGAGYPTGQKWALLAAADGERKFVVANGDEGDPGAYMDRTVMEDDPHRVLEGLLIAAYATGAQEAYLYVRAEYPRAIERLERAIRAARRHGLLGRRVLGTDVAVDVEVRIGAGAFVCGEETALMASIEGRRGLPVLRPPYPTERGLWGHPTMIQNVETLASVPAIVADGPEAFRSVGTPESAGTKVFALAGDLVNTGLIEVPMGISLREIVEEIGGGVPEGRAFKAAQTGGPSGGCIPASFLDTPVDYESLRALGSIMGSGGLVVMDERVSMPEVAKFFMEFCRDESCGKCVPCRAGTVQLHALLSRICDGKASRRDLGTLESLGRTVRDTSLCGLGQTAPNPVFSTLDHFRDEYLDLLTDAEAVAHHG